MYESVQGDVCFFFFQAEAGIRDHCVTGVQTCALPIFLVLRLSVRVSWFTPTIIPRAATPRYTNGASNQRARSEERRVGEERRTAGGTDRRRKETQRRTNGRKDQSTRRQMQDDDDRRRV